jgi:hypothetical protein
MRRTLGLKNPCQWCDRSSLLHLYKMMAMDFYQGHEWTTHFSGQPISDLDCPELSDAGNLLNL